MGRSHKSLSLAACLLLAAASVCSAHGERNITEEEAAPWIIDADTVGWPDLSEQRAIINAIVETMCPGLEVQERTPAEDVVKMVIAAVREAMGRDLFNESAERFLKLGDSPQGIGVTKQPGQHHFSARYRVKSDCISIRGTIDKGGKYRITVFCTRQGAKSCRDNALAELRPATTKDADVLLFKGDKRTHLKGVLLFWNGPKDKQPVEYRTRNEGIKRFGEMPDDQKREFLESLAKERESAEDELKEFYYHLGDDDSRMAAAYALGLIRSEKAASSLARSLCIENKQFDEKQKTPALGRYPVADALVEIGTPSVKPLLKGLSQSDSAKWRELAVQTLVRIEGKDGARKAIAEAAKEADDRGKALLNKALAELDRM